MSDLSQGIAGPQRLRLSHAGPRSVPAHGFVARLGGDDFAILVDDADDLSLCRLAERLVRVVAEPMEVNGHTFEIGCNVGAARFHAEDLTLQRLVSRADAALYDAKHKCRHTWKLSA